jgi:hypothetical protein
LFLYSFKHEAFAEENEWRAIFDFHRYQYASILKFRSNSGSIIPYIEKPLWIVPQDNPPLPLVEVVYGPTLHPELTRKALHLLLGRSNYEFVEVIGSSAPLRT